MIFRPFPFFADTGRKDKNYVSCGECGKVVLKESLPKHTQDVHEKSNKLVCKFCNKTLSGPFSLKEHIRAIHEKVMKHKCVHCGKGFSHFSNMNRHVRLIHEKLVISAKYVNCPKCQKLVQATSLKKHMMAIHEKTRDHICDYCDKGFSQSYTLKVRNLKFSNYILFSTSPFMIHNKLRLKIFQYENWSIVKLITNLPKNLELQLYNLEDLWWANTVRFLTAVL